MVKFNDDRESTDVEDRRGQGGSYGSADGGLQIPVSIGGRGGIGIVGLLLMLGAYLIFGIDLRPFMGGGDTSFPMPSQDQQGQSLPQWNVPGLPGGQAANAGVGAGGIKPGADPLDHYVKQVLLSTREYWTPALQAMGKTYGAPTLVLYDSQTRTGCGAGQAAMGPFYCPEDEKVYLDLTFYKELATRFGVPGNFAQAYVVAHEIGHHVQKRLGIADQVMAYKEKISQKDGNALQVRMELQADCFAGVWFNNAAKSKQLTIEPNDLEGGMNAAHAIGDDTLQKQATGRIVPDAFTHGSAEQRMRWLRRGLDSGNPQDCETFNTNSL